MMKYCLYNFTNVIHQFNDVHSKHWINYNRHYNITYKILFVLLIYAVGKSLTLIISFSSLFLRRLFIYNCFTLLIAYSAVYRISLAHLFGFIYFFNYLWLIITGILGSLHRYIPIVYIVLIYLVLFFNSFISTWLLLLK